MNRFEERYPELFQFFGGHFNEDWEVLLPEGYDRTSAGALKEAFANKDDARLLELQRIFREFLREIESLDEPALRVILRELGSSYYAPWDGSTFRSWLESIDKQLDETIAERMRLV